MAKNKQKSKRHKTAISDTPIRTISYREQKYQAWKVSNPDRKLLYSAYQDNDLWSWYDDNSVTSTRLSVDDDGNETVQFVEVKNSKIAWNSVDFYEKIMPKEDNA